jgi:hypothetical protein
MKSFTTIKSTQNEFLEQFLRGTGRTISSRQAESTYGIKNIRARMSELRSAGLKVRSVKNSMGRTAYTISARDVTGSRARAI